LAFVVAAAGALLWPVTAVTGVGSNLSETLLFGGALAGGTLLAWGALETMQARGSRARDKRVRELAASDPAYAQRVRVAVPKLRWWHAVVFGGLVAADVAFRGHGGIAVAGVSFVLMTVYLALQWWSLEAPKRRAVAVRDTFHVVEGDSGRPSVHMALGPADQFRLADAVSRPIARIALSPEQLESRLAIHFSDSWDGAEFVHSAAFDLPTIGRIALVRSHENVDVHLEEGAPVPSLERLAKALGLARADLV
jgi:hypothetical protein